jgi:hypothetical protein
LQVTDALSSSSESLFYKEALREKPADYATGTNTAGMNTGIATGTNTTAINANSSEVSRDTLIRRNQKARKKNYFRDLRYNTFSGPRAIQALRGLLREDSDGNASSTSNTNSNTGTAEILTNTERILSWILAASFPANVFTARSPSGSNMQMTFTVREPGNRRKRRREHYYNDSPEKRLRSFLEGNMRLKVQNAYRGNRNEVIVTFDSAETANLARQLKIPEQ